MVHLIGTEAMLHISFSLAAFIFSVVLLILVCALGTGQVHNNYTFRTLTITIVFGNLVSILDNIFRDAGIFPTPPEIKLLLLLSAFVANILLTYYVALYMEGFFHDFRLKKPIHKINRILVFSALLLAGGEYLLRILIYKGDPVLADVPMCLRIILGYVYELYFLVYTFILFIAFGKTLSKRARITSVAAFAVVIGSVLLELVNTFELGSGILYNYLGAVIGLYIFYIGVETPDYRNLLQSLSDLDKARKAADEANHSKSDFLANMSHEIRTPINAVLGMNEMILREAEDGDILSYAENIRNAGTTLLGLINDILDFSKIEAGRIELVNVNYDLASLISDLVNMIQPRAEAKGLLLRLDIDRSIPGQLLGDEVRIRQIITNILTNAVKYTEKGGVTFSIGFERIENDPESINLKVSVRDTGIGIKPEDINKLFLEFERIEEKRNRNIEGTGLGMSITKSLLDLMGSSLQVESSYGVGSNFSFSLRQKVVSWDGLGDFEEACRKQQSEHKRYQERFSAPEARALVVDDNQMNLMVFKSLIKQTLIQVDTADNGSEGLSLSRENKYDIIFLDHMMPGMDGVEVLHELKSREDDPNKDTPVICLTANAISGAKTRYLDEGFEDYLSKPIDTSEMERIFLDYLPKEKIKDPVVMENKTPAETPGETGIPEDLRPLEEYRIDVEYGIRGSDGTEVYRSLLKVFYETMDERAIELDRFLNEEKYDDYTTLVHALKSSLRIIGAKDMGEEAQRLENAGKSGDRDYIAKHHEDFILSCRKIKEPLTAIFESGNREENLKKADSKTMSRVYDEIEAAAAELQLDRLEEIFKDMSGYEIPEEEKDLWNRLKDACDRFEYQEMTEILKQR